MDDNLDVKPTPASLLQRAGVEEASASRLESAAMTGLDRASAERGVERERRGTELKSDAASIDQATADLQAASGTRQHVEMPSADLGPMLDPEQTQKFAFALLTMSLIGAAAGKKHWGESMAALDGMLQGMKAGNEELIKEKKAKFEREFRIAKEKQAEANSVYDDLIRSKTLSLNARFSQMKVHAAANHDWEMWQAADEKRYDKMLSIAQQRRTASDKLTTQAAQFQDRLDARAEKAEERKAKESASAGQGSFTEQDVAYWAEVMQKGGSLPPRLATTPGGKWLTQQVMSRVSGSGTTPSEMLSNQAEFMGQKAGQRTLGTRTANIEMAGTEADMLADLALKASGEWKRTGIKTFNDLEKYAQGKTASPELRRFVAANTSFINAYARAINPQGVGTVADKEHAREMLEVGFAKGDYAAAIDQLKSEIGVAKHAPGKVKESMREGFTGSRRAADNTFASEDEARAAAKAGTLKDGARVTIGGVPGTWKDD